MPVKATIVKLYVPTANPSTFNVTHVPWAHDPFASNAPLR